MPEDNPEGIRDPGTAGQAGGISDGSSPAAGKTSTHGPDHKAHEPSGVARGPVTKRDPKESEPELSDAGTPPGPLEPGNRA